MAISGFATAEGTTRYRTRHSDCHPSHFRQWQGCWAPSIGFGTYLGDPDEATDRLYAEAIEAALRHGCNLIDTAINYRCQRSERVIGATLQRLVEDGRVRRDEVILCTKGGYVPFDGTMPRDPGRYLIDTFLGPGIFRHEDLVAGCHCLKPGYLEHQLSASLRNLQVDTIDGYYLHNPEQQLDEVSREVFRTRMEAALRFLEDQAAAGRLRWYGTATWNGYRVNPNASDYLSLHDLIELAQQVGGANHHFRVVQLPYNLAMPEAFAFRNQPFNDTSVSLLEAAQHFGISVVTSAGLLQTRLVTLPKGIAERIPGLVTDAQRALQFARSAPGVTTALVGMKQQRHVEENLALAHQPTASAEQLTQLFTKTTKP